MRRGAIGGVGIVLALAGAAPAARAAEPGTLQGRFDAATAAWQGGDCAAALPLFEALAKDPRVMPGSLPAAAIAVRRGDCLVRTGHAAEGEALIRAGLPPVRAGGAEFAEEVAGAEFSLGSLAFHRWDHDAALAHFRAALALQQGARREPTLMLIAQTAAFDHDGVALAAADEGLSLASAERARKTVAQWYTMRGRILLNDGKITEGRADLTRALDEAGRFASRLTIAEAALRADAAQAAMLAHDKQAAYQYMAESGAGRIEKSPFATAARMEAPPCGPDTGLDPADVAVVEFMIGDDGTVLSAQPVYATGNYAKAVAFARAVRKWSWKPADAAQIPQFFRLATRVELRCSNAAGDGGVSALGPLRGRFVAWGGGQLVRYAKPARRFSWRDLVDIAERARGDHADAAELAARVILSEQDLRAEADVQASIERGLALADAGQVPEPARNAARVLLTEALPARGSHASRFSWQRQNDARLLSLADDPALANDALAQDTALLVGVAQRPESADLPAALARLRRVAEDPRLGAHHPLQQLAQLRLANEAARVGDLAEAQRWYGQTGLTGAQCALIGPKPALASYGHDGYPWEALRFGFEGWVRTEFDIAANGTAVGVRPVIAYPPLVFGKPASDLMATARFQSSFRPDGAAACSASSETIKFRVPENTNTVHTVPAKKQP